MRTQNLLGMDFCQNQASGIHFDIPGIKLRQPPKTFCYGSVHPIKTFPSAQHFRYFSPDGPAVARYSRTEERMKGRKEDKILLHDPVY